MTAPLTPATRLRDDLSVVEIDGDLVIFDPVRMQSHVLSGGAAVVWTELQKQPMEVIVAQVARRTGRETDAISSEVGAVLRQFEELSLLTSRAPNGEDVRTES